MIKLVLKSIIDDVNGEREYVEERGVTNKENVKLKMHF